MNPVIPAAAPEKILRSISREDMAKLAIRRYEGRICLVATPGDVHAAAAALRARNVPLVHEPKTHRDGSVSCYCRDPDGNLVQILYLPGPGA